MLQPPAFDPTSDAAPNYGDTGGTIGHELTHGFDEFDAQGNLRDWSTKRTRRNFRDCADCISNQYSNYTIIDDIKIDGKLTLGEDVADLGGLLLAYNAWKKEDTKNQKLDSALDDLTPISASSSDGQSWCGQSRDETKRLRATVDPAFTERSTAQQDRLEHAGIPAGLPLQSQIPMVNANRCRVW